MNSARENLRQKARLAPEGPGIYIHRGKDKEVLYVGKAKNLKNRLKSYFFGTEHLPHRTRQLVSRVSDFDIVLAQNENESLVLESQFIKSHKPPFNVLLRDDKGYPYVRIDLTQKWPQIRMVRRRREENALYFGPYASGGQIAGVLQVIRRFFPLVKCSPHIFKSIPRPCQYFHMKQCLAPCHLPVSEEQYREHVDAVIALLKGQIKDVKASLLELMNEASELTDYERAATYRDQIRAIEELGQSQSVDFGIAFNVDLFGVFWGQDSFSVAVLSIRSGQAVASFAYSSKYEVDMPDLENEGLENHQRRLRLVSLFALLRQYFLDHTASSDLVILDRENLWSEVESKLMLSFLNALSQAEGSHVVHTDMKAFSAGLSRSLVRKQTVEDLQRLEVSVLDTARQKYQHDKMVSDQAENLMLGLQTFLGLKSLPTFIECFDISTFQGRETVASQVVFREGKPSKKHYRKYVIRSIETQDDFGSLREVMRRRFRDVSSTEIPDLVLVDGGEPQVREVLKTLISLGFDQIKLAGIAKSRTKSHFTSDKVVQSQERLVIPVMPFLQDKPSLIGQDLESRVAFETRVLRVGSPEYRLVTQMRDEAHRFAITFHRERRSKSSAKSLLDGIAGIGPKRKMKLLQVFDRPADMLSFSAKEMAHKTGFSVSFCEDLQSKVREIKGSNLNQKK